MQIYCVSDVHTDYSANLQWQAPAPAAWAARLPALHPERCFMLPHPPSTIYGSMPGILHRHVHGAPA